MKLPLRISEDVKKLNPGLFGLAGLSHPQRQPDQRREGQDRELAAGPGGLGYRVTIISLRKRLVDAHDNLRTGAKPLVDAITATLGFASDDDPRLTWAYAQLIDDSEGTIVRIECRHEPLRSPLH